jgi:myo-inositol-1(or 4)-monophosphatase
MWEGDVWVATRAARAGADVVQSGFYQGYDTDMKGVVNPVTQIDRDAEEVIKSIIASYFPKDGFLGEESGGGDWKEGRIWIVDPLDGTVNYIHGIPQVAVSVALWTDGEPQVGVIIDVARNDEYVAVSGGGSAPNSSPMRVSTTAALGDSMILTGFPYDQRDHASDYLDLTAALLEGARAVRCLGSAALDLAWVASGTADGYCEHGGLHGLKPWDLAAGILLVTEAGGTVTDDLGNRSNLEAAAFVASNGAIHDALVTVVNETMPPHLR